MKKNLILTGFFIALGIQGLSAQGNYADWSRFIEGSESSRFNNVLFDGENIIANGYWFLDAKFGDVDLPYFTSTNGIIAKLDTAGNTLWTTTITGEGYENFFEIVLDNDKNIIAAGWSTSTLPIEVNGVIVHIPEPGLQTRSVLAKFSGVDGSLIWYKTYMSDTEYSSVLASRLAIDQNNNIYVGGYYDNSFTVDELNFLYNQEQPYGASPYILKFDSDGNGVWGQTFDFVSEGYIGFITARSMCVKNGSLYYAFEYSKPIIVKDSILPYEGFGNWLAVAALSTDLGIVTNVKAFGSTENQGIGQIKLDKDGNLIMGGYFTAGSNFAIGTINLTGSTGYNGFIAKLDDQINPIWAKTISNDVDASVFHVNIGDRNQLFFGGGYYTGNVLSFGEDTLAPSMEKPHAGMYQLVTNSDGEYIASGFLTGTNELSVINYGNAAFLSGGKIIAVGAATDSVEFEKGEYFYSDHGSAFIMKWSIAGAEGPSAISGNTVLGEISFYPNPSKGDIQFEGIKGFIKADIFDLNGCLLKSFGFADGNNHFELSDLKNGLYIVKVTTNTGVFSGRLLLQR